MKRLGGIVDADASIMAREAVRMSVTSSFLDEAVSVRQVPHLPTYFSVVLTATWDFLACSPELVNSGCRSQVVYTHCIAYFERRSVYTVQ